MPPSPDTTLTVLKLKNLEESATTPLLIQVSVETRKDGTWTKPIQVIHPSPFVLNRHEQQILRSTIRQGGEAVRARVVIRESETNKEVYSREFEKPLK